MADTFLQFMISDELLDVTADEIAIAVSCNEFRRLTDSSSETRDNVPRIFGYVENTISCYLEEDYRTRYRISKRVFEIIVERITPGLTRKHGEGIEETSPHKQVLNFLWYMANQDSMLELSTQFGIGISTTHNILKRVFRVFIAEFDSVFRKSSRLKLQKEVMKWPDHNEQQNISDSFQLQSGLAGIMGVLDGTHIRLSSCPKNDSDYINRKAFPSMQLQVMCDNNLLIRHCYTGWPGCTHDARVLRNSSLINCGDHNCDMIAQNKFIIADFAYPLRGWLITPFKDNGRLSLLQKRFNKVLSSSRQCVERCIGHLKGRFRGLREITLHEPEDIVQNIICGCILHNLCIIRDDFVEYFIDHNQDDGHPNRFHNIFHNAVTGINRSNQLMNGLP